jgi:lipopolysaccharide/colanic/teichoic acid biosynthesis glycosyltransferase
MVSTLDTTIFDDTSFAQLLAVERKRTDRSHRPFLLLLIELQIRLWDGQRRKRALVKNVVQALRLCTRQTDMIGWYKSNAVIGVIYTELRHAGRSIDTILARVNAALQAHLLPAQLQAIAITAYVYPQHEPGVPPSAPNDKLYVDLKQHTLPRLGKRALDIVGGFVLLVLCAPVFVLIGVAIKCTSHGPILFKQTRIGQFGKPFTFLKFRSMYADADPRVHEQYIQAFMLQSRHGGNALETLKHDGLFKLSNDARITPLGHFLRKTSLDELPQLLNVLAGTMSLVGPRPPILYELKDYDIWHRRRVLEAKPGLTGLWQVTGRSRTTFDDMVRLDLQYIDQRSLWTDLKLLLRTPWSVLKCDGAR